MHIPSRSFCAFCVFLGLTLCLLLTVLRVPPLRAQTQPAFAPGSMDIASTAAQLERQIKAAKRPKSDKWVFSLLPVGLSRNPQVDYAIVTEMTNDGRSLPEPSFDKPVYYIAHSVGQQNVGDAYGGTRDIQYEYLRKQLNAALASNGYRAIDPGAPPEDPDKAPTQVLFFAWGMHNRMEPARASMSEDPPEDGDITERMPVDQIPNLLSRAKTIGGQKFADEFARALSESFHAGNLNPMRDFARRDDTTETLVYELSDDCYYMIVYSYELEALRSNLKKLLWITRISTRARGVSFEQTLPIMINNGAYFFGRETKPEILRKRAYKNATVEIGEATVVDYMSGTTAPATNNPKSPPPKPRQTPGSQ